MNHPKHALVVDMAIGFFAGVVATKVTGYAQEASYRVMPNKVKEQEERVRPADPPEVAAKKIARLFGTELEGKKIETAASLVHYGLGTAWGPIYGLLRRSTGISAPAAGVASGAAMSLIVDEALTPALRLSAPNRDYPPITHVRGFMNHLVFGAVNAAAAEALYRALDVVRPAGPTFSPTRS